MAAMAIAATRCVDQAGEQNGPAVLTRHVELERHLLRVVTTTALLNLVRRRDGRCKIGNRMDDVWTAMAIGATCLALVSASTHFTLRP